MTTIVVSVTCYENENEVLEFADKLSKQDCSENIAFLITCNRCMNIDVFRMEMEKIKLKSYIFNPGKNLGYLNGCLYGLKEYGENYTWAVISNTDIEFMSNQFFKNFVGEKYGTEIGCVGPDVCLQDAITHQNPFFLKRPGRRAMRLRRFIYSSYPLYSFYCLLSSMKTKLKKKVVERSGQVYSVHGSIVMLRKKVVDVLLEGDIQTFMYGEELCIAEIVRKNNLITYYDKELKIMHKENQVTGKIPNRRKQEWISQSTSFLVNRFWS